MVVMVVGMGFGMRRLRLGLRCGHFKSSERAVGFYGVVMAGMCWFQIVRVNRARGALCAVEINV